MRLKMTDGWRLINDALTVVMAHCTNARTKQWRVPAKTMSLVCSRSTCTCRTEKFWRTITALSVRSIIDELFWVISLIWAHVVSSYLKSLIISGMYPRGKSSCSFWVPLGNFSKHGMRNCEERRQLVADTNHRSWLLHLRHQRLLQQRETTEASFVLAV